VPQKLIGKLVIATHNAGKLTEMRTSLSLWSDNDSAADLGLPEPKKPAELSSQMRKSGAPAADRANIPALADDSGLCVERSMGLQASIPRVGRGLRGFRRAMRKVEQALRARRLACRSSSFRLRPCPRLPRRTCTASKQGLCELVFPPRQTRFCYDPIFLPEGYARTFGEMTAWKSTHSHGWFAACRIRPRVSDFRAACLGGDVQ